MKKWLILSIITNIGLILYSIFLIVSAESVKRATNHQFQIEHYQTKTKLATKTMIKDTAIIFAGDSQIEYGNWNELFNRNDILNRGIAGDVTAGLIGRMDEITRHNPSKVFIEIGTNDLGRGISIAQVIEDYRQVISILKTETTAKIFINSVLPVQDLPYEGYQNAEINHLNRQLKELCLSKKITFIDLSDIFNDESGNLKSELTNDGLHLTANGYLLWVEKLKQYL
jgi:lysophospholipase L1-like esterase